MYWIDWFDSPRYWRDGVPVSSDAPPDFVLVICPQQTLNSVQQIPRLQMLNPSWVFPDEPREFGPVVGMILKTTVRKAPGGLTLNACGPCTYRASLNDYSAVQWKDEIQLRVVSVDHDSRSLVGEFIQKLSPKTNAR